MDSRTTWVLFNLGCRVDDFSDWLAHELGHALTLHALQCDDGETFAERFSQQLLFPESVARQALEAIRAASDQMATASWYAGSFAVSIVTVVKAADRVAEKRGEAPTGLNTGLPGHVGIDAFLIIFRASPPCGWPTTGQYPDRCPG